MVKLAPAERALASTVIPTDSAANLRCQQTQHTIVLYSRTVLPKTNCTAYNYHKQSKVGGKKHGPDS